MKSFLSLFIFFILLNPLSFAEKTSSAKKTSSNIIVIKSKIPKLTKKKAVQLWQEISSQLQEMESNCSSKISLNKKVLFSANKMQEIAKHSKKIYKTYQYSFSSVNKKKYGKNKKTLDILLSDIQNVLTHNTINYKKIKSKKSCKMLKSSFLISYRSYYNMDDFINTKKKMPSWAQRLYTSLNCLCPNLDKPSRKTF